jgi:hypothetical protein
MTLQKWGVIFKSNNRKECVMADTSWIAMGDLKNLTPKERLNVFANLNSSDLELLSHHCSVELQERALGEQTANERLIWKDK